MKKRAQAIYNQELRLKENNRRFDSAKRTSRCRAKQQEQDLEKFERFKRSINICSLKDPCTSVNIPVVNERNIDEVLIVSVKKYPVLYFCSKKLDENSPSIKKIWDEIGIRLNMKGKDCQRKWNDIRDSFRRCVADWKKYDQNFSSIKRYKHGKLLSFLLPHILGELKTAGHNATCSSILSKEVVAVNEKIINLHSHPKILTSASTEPPKSSTTTKTKTTKQQQKAAHLEISCKSLSTNILSKVSVNGQTVNAQSLAPHHSSTNIGLVQSPKIGAAVPKVVLSKFSRNKVLVKFMNGSVVSSFSKSNVLTYDVTPKVAQSAALSPVKKACLQTVNAPICSEIIKPMDHITKYFETIEKTVRNFNPDIQSNVMSKISQIMHEAEFPNSSQVSNYSLLSLQSQSTTRNYDKINEENIKPDEEVNSLESKIMSTPICKNNFSESQSLKYKFNGNISSETVLPLNFEFHIKEEEMEYDELSHTDC